MFSVIVPIYNVENYIGQCIESVLNQTYDDFELILVNDGSNDKSREICEKYQLMDNRIKIINKENGGLVSARKRGAIDAKGDYIVCLDGDDWININYLEIIKKYIDEYDPDMICFNYYKAYGNKLVKVESFKDIKIIKDKNEIISYLIEDEYNRSFSPSIWSKVYKRDLYLDNQLLVNNDIKIGEDAACSKLCLLYSQTILLVNDLLYYYRQNNSSMTRNKSVFDYNGPKLLGNHYFDNIKQYNLNEQIYRNITHNLFNVVVSIFNKKQSYFESRKEINILLQNEFYKTAIKNTKYKNFLGKLCKYSLKYHLILFIYLYHIKIEILGGHND